MFLAPFAGITCFGRTTIGAVREDPLLWRRFRPWSRRRPPLPGPAASTCRPDEEEQRLELARKLPTEMKSSMLHDLEAGRRLELDWLTGAVVRLGAERGVATPASAEVYEALAPSARRRGYRAPDLPEPLHPTPRTRFV